MKMYRLRSCLFNVCFLSATAVSCILYLPTLLLPRKYYLNTVSLYLATITFLEEYVMGITYEIRGLENLPKDGAYLVAAKHQSLYETFKLRVLFDDPAIILKEELTRIPIWGAYLTKSDVITIDRSTPKEALKSITDGALRMKEQGRPIVIFPQGTRVHPDDTPKDKPYKPGITRIQDATKLPIIPMALNSGFFWPRRGWLKRPGTVIFEFLKPIKPKKTERKKLMAQLETRIEKASDKLKAEAVKEAKIIDAPRKKSPLLMALSLTLLVLAYSALWFVVAEKARAAYLGFLQDLGGAERSYTIPKISGFPGKVQLFVAEEYLQNPEGTLKVQNLKAKGWPIPFLPVKISASALEITSFKWNEPLDFDGFDASVTVKDNVLNILESSLRRETFEGGVVGSVDFRQEPYPKFDLMVSLHDHESFITHLAMQNIIEPRAALFIGAGLSSLKQDGVVRVPITQRDRTLYAGPLAIGKLPKARSSAY